MNIREVTHFFTFLLLLIFLFFSYPYSNLADVERVILTPEILQERIKSPQL